MRYQDYVLLTYQEVITGVDRINWSKAIEEEKKSLEENETWEAVRFEEMKDVKSLHT